MSRHTQGITHQEEETTQRKFLYKNQQLCLQRVQPTPLTTVYPAFFISIFLNHYFVSLVQPTMEQLTTSLAPTRASPPKSATPGTSSESAGSVTKRHVSKYSRVYIVHHAYRAFLNRLSSELMTLMVSTNRSSCVTHGADNKSQMSASPGIVSAFNLSFTRFSTVLNMHIVRVSEIRGEPV